MILPPTYSAAIPQKLFRNYPMNIGGVSAGIAQVLYMDLIESEGSGDLVSPSSASVLLM